MCGLFAIVAELKHPFTRRRGAWNMEPIDDGDVHREAPRAQARLGPPGFRIFVARWVKLWGHLGVGVGKRIPRPSRAVRCCAVAEEAALNLGPAPVLPFERDSSSERDGSLLEALFSQWCRTRTESVLVWHSVHAIVVSVDRQREAWRNQTVCDPRTSTAMLHRERERER